MAKVSVIIPNYNHARFLKQRIDTVLNQTYQDFDLLIMDDCSTDDSRTIIESYRNHHKVKILYNSENSGGVFKQWQKGVNNTSGNYVWIAESDDYSDLNFLYEMTTILDSYSDVKITFSANVIVDENNKQITELKRNDFVQDKKIKDDLYLINGITEAKTNLLNGCSIPNVSSCVFKREMTQYLNDSIDYTLCGDWIFYIKIALTSNLIYLHKPLNFFRDSSSSVRNKTSKAGTFFKEKLNIFFYLNNVFKFNKEIRKNYVRDFSYVFLHRILYGNIYLKKIDFFKTLLELNKIHPLAPFFIGKNLFSIFFTKLFKLKSRSIYK